MADRTSVVDPAVDELRRKARRRLVGAIVLALAAAVILPMLLEKEPRPLGEDVAVRIPPIDNGKFVNRLSGDSGKESSASGAASPPVPGSPQSSDANAPASVAAPDQALLTPGPAASPKAPASASASDAATPSSSIAKAEPTVAPVNGSAAGAKTEAAEAKPSEAKAEPKSAAAKATPGEGAYVVQLAAFSDDKGANALASKLKHNGYPAYTEAVQTARGTLYRVRVGGYPTREAAGDARNKLKGDGYAGIIAAAR